MSAEILATAIRGETAESVHTGHAVAIDGDGKTVFSLGDPETVAFFRSASKPFQFIPCITSGAADAFGFTEEEFALAVASHSGEERHTRIAASMLQKAGFTESDLRCGAHLPFNAEAAAELQRSGAVPTQLHNNCSGKHAAMLALARHIGADTATYAAPEHRVQQRILRCVADFTEIPADRIALGIDGCAAPNFAVPLTAMAKSFISLLTPERFPEITQAACRRIVDAMLKFPELIGGTERLDTMLIEKAGGKLISKVGADGVWLCGVLPSEKFPRGLAIALKVADGDDQFARPVAAVAILRGLGLLAASDLPDVSPMPIKNRLGDQVGRIEPAFSL